MATVALSPQDILCEARERIKEKGWTHGREQSASGAVCLMRACKDVLGKHYTGLEHEMMSTLVIGCLKGPAGIAVYDSLAASISATQSGDWGQIVSWNDKTGRQEFEVLNALSRAGNCGEIVPEWEEEEKP